MKQGDVFASRGFFKRSTKSFSVEQTNRKREESLEPGVLFNLMGKYYVFNQWASHQMERFVSYESG